MPETKLMPSSATSRRGGWWGMAFVVTLFVSVALVSLPTGRQTGRAIAAFYAAHAGAILVQQVLGLVTLAFFLAFALALRARRGGGCWPARYCSPSRNLSRTLLRSS